MSLCEATTQISPSDVFSQSPIIINSSYQNSSEESSEINSKSKSLSSPSLLISSISSEYNKKYANKSSSSRLFKSSIKKEKTENKSETLPEHSISCIGSSAVLVDTYVKTIVNKIFGQEEFISKQDLTNAFKELGILSKSETLIDKSIIRNEVMKWKVDTNTFDNEAAKMSIIDSRTGAKKGKFNLYVKSQTDAYFANKRDFKTTEKDKKEKEKIVAAQNKKKNKSYNLDRLLMTKEELKEERGNKTVRKEYVPPLPPEVKSFINEESKRIVEESPLGECNQIERDEIFRQNSKLKVQRISQEVQQEIEWSIPIYPKNPAYDLTPEEREKFEERKREKFEASIPKYPYRPKITSWEEYEKIRERMYLSQLDPSFKPMKQ